MTLVLNTEEVVQSLDLSGYIEAMEEAFTIDGRTFAAGSLVVIRGEIDDTIGRVDLVISYDGFRTGRNRLLLHRDSAVVLNPRPEAATIVRVQDFDPNLLTCERMATQT